MSVIYWLIGSGNNRWLKAPQKGICCLEADIANFGFVVKKIVHVIHKISDVQVF